MKRLPWFDRVQGPAVMKIKMHWPEGEKAELKKGRNDCRAQHRCPEQSDYHVLLHFCIFTVLYPVHGKADTDRVSPLIKTDFPEGRVHIFRSQSL